MRERNEMFVASVENQLYIVERDTIVVDMKERNEMFAVSVENQL